MANFEWLALIPNAGWERFEAGGLYRVFPLNLFLERSGVQDGNDTWAADFERWSQQQPRYYTWLRHPPIGDQPAILVFRPPDKFDGSICVFQYPDMTERRVRFQVGRKELGRVGGVPVTTALVFAEDVDTGVRLELISLDTIQDESGNRLNRKQ